MSNYLNQQISVIDSERTIQDVLVDMLNYVIESHVRKPPYIINVSKQQLWCGKGPLFKNCGDPCVKAGIIKNMGIRRPSKHEKDRAEMRYGYRALIGPEKKLNDLTNHTIRQKILWAELESCKYSDIVTLLGKGYIRSDGTLDPNQTRGYSVYFFMLRDTKVRDAQRDWLWSHKDEKDKWVQYQFLRNQVTHDSMLIERKKIASKIVIMNKALLKITEWKELTPRVDRAKLDWLENGYESQLVARKS